MDAYFDMFSGISGNMVLGALLDLGLDKDILARELERLTIRGEFALTVKKADKRGIHATYVEVELLKNRGDHRHPEEPTFADNSHMSGKTIKHQRMLSDILRIIDSSDLSDSVKSRSGFIFTKLAEAEAKVHNMGIQEVHFHEVGAVDAIVDIVGSVIGIELLGIEKITGSRINTGTGFVRCEHGTLPVPSPATIELLKGKPVHSTGIERELVTPTGAAIITSLADRFGPLPEMTIERTGYGAGKRDLEIPNVLRVSIGRFD